MKSVCAFTHSRSALGQAGEAVCVAELSNECDSINPCSVPLKFCNVSTDRSYLR